MTKILMLAITFLTLSACGNTHYEYYRGQDGVNGATGAKGDTGDTGAAGIDASPMTAVKLCPGVTVYPSNFTEVAFCINNKLYGTYSANGGFSTELPPGTYGSNGINSSCNFVIGANCTITN
jgi:hypothetical protein